MSDLTYLRVGAYHQDAQERSGYERRGSMRGFTLIELMVVVVILAIAALTAVPMMSSASSMQIRSAVNLIMADLEYAKSMAITRGNNYSVVFNTATDSYQIEDLSKAVGNPERIIEHPVKKGFDYIVSFQNDSRLNRVDITGANFFNGSSSIEFDCLGSPVDITSQGTVTLQAGSMTATVTVEPVTGFISSQ